MSRQIILHFGGHKTGSTSIQHSLYGLSCREWHVLNTREGGNESLSINQAFRSVKDKSQLNQTLSRQADSIKDAYRHQITTSPARNFLLSAEALESMSEKDLQAIYNFFQSQDLSLTFAGYMRPVTSCINSIFQQRVKGSPNFANTNKSLDELASLCSPHYSQVYTKLKRISSPTSIRLFGFDPSSFPDKNVVVDFCIRLGIPVEYKKIKRVNASLSMTSVKLLWVNDKNSQGTELTGNKRLEFIRALTRDFSDMPQFTLDYKILNRQAEATEAKLMYLDQIIESHGEFSLTKRLDKNSQEKMYPVADVTDLEVFSEKERNRIASILNSHAKAPKDTCGDQELALIYLDTVLNNNT